MVRKYRWERHIRIPKVISNTADAARSVFAADMDGDGDNDVLLASELDNTIAWYQNTDGKGTFSTEKIITTTLQPTSVYAVDLDNDMDNDIVFASYGDKQNCLVRKHR